MTAWILLSNTPAGAAYALAAPEQEEEGLKAHVGESMTWDDNLFRLPDGQKPADGGPRSTRLNQTSAGISFDHTYSLQRIGAAVSVTNRSYSDHSDQNATTVDGNLIWDWALGNQWSGKLGLIQNEAPRSFADTLLRRERSINTLRQAVADAEYLWHPSWSTVLGATQTQSRYSDRPSQGAEYDETAVTAGVGYRPASGNRLDLVARFADGDYPNRSDTADVASGYTQRDLRLQGKWQVTGHSRVSGYAGYTRRTYSNQDRLDFSGPTGRLVYDWEPTGKLALRAVVRRELGPIDEVIDNFVVSRAVSLEPRWMVTDKVTLWTNGEWLKRDLGQNPQTLDENAQTRSFGLGLTYKPRPRIELTTAYQHSERSASEPQLEYTDNLTKVDFRMAF